MDGKPYCKRHLPENMVVKEAERAERSRLSSNVQACRNNVSNERNRLIDAVLAVDPSQLPKSVADAVVRHNEVRRHLHHAEKALAKFKDSGAITSAQDGAA